MNQLFIVQLEECVCLHINPCITKCTHTGILTEPYINLKTLRTDCNLLLIPETQTAATLWMQSKNSVFFLQNPHILLVSPLQKLVHTFLDRDEKLLTP